LLKIRQDAIPLDAGVALAGIGRVPRESAAGAAPHPGSRVATSRVARPAAGCGSAEERQSGRWPLPAAWASGRPHTRAHRISWCTTRTAARRPGPHLGRNGT